MGEIQVLRSAYQAITSDPRYLENIEWGVPRIGHPEGTVLNHIEELTENLTLIDELLDVADVWRLRIMIQVHDTFKAECCPGSPTHGELAAAFLAEFLPTEVDMINMVAQHDTMFFIWRKGFHSGVFDEDEIQALSRKIKDWDLFAIFMLIDGLTAGKDPRPLDWMVDEVERRHLVSEIVRPMKDAIEEEVGRRTAYL